MLHPQASEKKQSSLSSPIPQPGRGSSFEVDRGGAGGVEHETFSTGAIGRLGMSIPRWENY